MAIDTTKPFTIFLLSALGAAILGSMLYFGDKNKANLSESIELFFQKMAPALNETTGFLAISYAVILCIGNVIMKTSPKYLASGGGSQEEKTTGFVAWLHSKGLGWLPIFISVTIVTLMTFLPINNKILKIGIIAIVLGGVLMAALFFNALIKLFGPKEKFTNVKEEFGHLIEDNPHDLQITIKVEPSNDPNKPDVIRHYIQDGGTLEYPHKPTKGDMKTAHNDSGGEGGSWNIPVNTESLTNTVTLIKSTSTSKQDVTKNYRIFITDVPFTHPDADTKHNIRELFPTSNGAGNIVITATAATTNLYFHAIKRELFYKVNKDKTEFEYPSSLPNPNINASATGAIANNKFSKLPLNFYQRDKVLKHAVNLEDNGYWIPNKGEKESTYKRTVVGKILTAVQEVDDDKGKPISTVESEDKKLLHVHLQQDNTKTKVAYEAAAKLAEQHRETESKELYTFLKELSGGNNYDKPNDKTAEAYRMVHYIEGQDYTNNGMRISLQNNEQFFGFDVKVVKDSVRASYISYYSLVWGSFVGYVVYYFALLRNDNFEPLKKIAPFLVAAVVETLLIAQSHYSLNESDVASSTGKPSPTFSYAVAGFSTRIATIVAFLSSILTQVKD
tara:strand:+ start:509 stop:2359 length:1851 start_codon:yes stop_codon:yes gene_type:complete